MTCTTCPTSTIPDADEAPAARGRLSPTASFYLQASITVSFLAGSSAPTPLYSLYQSQWGFSATMTTLIFGVYALAVLASLLVTGRLSDHIGRRPVLFAAIAAQLVAMIVFGTANGVHDLLIARVIQGLSAGAAVAAVGGGLLDIHKERGSIANAVSPPIGTGLGAILAGLLVQFLPAPTHLVYGVLAAVYYVQGIGVFFMAETHAPRRGAWASLKPTLKLSHSVRGPMLLAIPALVATWSLAGFYASLGPALVRGLVGINSSLAGRCHALPAREQRGRCSRCSCATPPRPRSRRLAPMRCSPAWPSRSRRSRSTSSIVFFIGTSVAGIGFGAGFQGAIRGIATHAAPNERAGALSIRVRGVVSLDGSPGSDRRVLRDPPGRHPRDGTRIRCRGDPALGADAGGRLEARPR